MSPAKNEPLYNLKVVLQETGINPDTLRAWERRYGLPKPERTAGGHRLYSDYDIEVIKWLITRQDEGMRINRAVELWKSLEAEGQVAFDRISHAKMGETKMPVIISGENLVTMRDAWVDACMEFDERAADHILAQAFARYPVESVCLDVLRGGLSDIGELWYTGQATVQQEHYASALATRKLSSMIAASPSPTRPETILVACPPEEQHVFAPMLVTLFLRYKGWNVVYLGADVPLANFEEAVDLTGAELVILNATMLITASNLYDVGTFMRSRKIAFAFGGNIFNRLPALVQRMPGHYLGEQLDHVAHKVSNLLNSPLLLPELGPISGDHLSAVEQILARQSQIAADVWESMKSNGAVRSSIEIANEYLGKNIVSALKLGNIEFLRAEIDWVASLITNHGLPYRILPEYLSSYAEAVTKYLPGNARLIADFLHAQSRQLVRVSE